jgi:outer membrane protein assembly factor BamA
MLLAAVGGASAQAPSGPVIVGASAVSREQLATIARTLPHASAIDSISALYAQLGYLSPSITISGDTMRIVEGARYRISSIAFDPDSLIATLRLGGYDESPYVGNPFSPGRIGELLDAVVAALSARGYPLAVARVGALGIDDSSATVDARIAIESGERVSVSEIDVEGNTVTERGLIVAAASVRRGTPFSDDLARQVRARLERLDLFSSVEEPQLYRTDSGGYGILVRVVEGNANTFDGILGYQPPEPGSSAGSLSGHLTFVLRNLFGTGRRLGVRFERTKPSQLLEVRYAEPYVLRLPLEIELGFRQRQEIASVALPSYVQRALSIDAAYSFLDAWSVRGGASFDETLPEVDTARACASQLLNSSTLLTTLGIAFDTRNNTVSPTSGARLTTSVTVGSKSVRSATQCYDSLAGTSEFRQRIAVDLDAFMSLGGPFVVASGLHGGEIRGNFLEESDLARIGGQSTVRGYREDEFRASRYAAATVEARVLLSRTSYAAVFVDGGYALRPEDAIQGTLRQEYWLLGYGVGAQVETPLGLVRFSYALGRNDTFETGKVFVGLVNRF